MTTTERVNAAARELFAALEELGVDENEIERLDQVIEELIEAADQVDL